MLIKQPFLVKYLTVHVSNQCIQKCPTCVLTNYNINIDYSIVNTIQHQENVLLSNKTKLKTHDCYINNQF